MTSAARARTVATMRTTIALALLFAACGATPNAPPPAADAAPSVDASGDGAACDFTRERLIPGRGCVSATPTDCDGMRCPAGQVCNTETGPDGGQVFRCITD